MKNMEFTLKSLYRNGMVLDVKEIAEEHLCTGSFVLEDGQMGRRARFLDPIQNNLSDMVPPLVDAEIVSMGATYLMVRGYEIQSKSGVALRYKQCWLLRSI